MTLTEEHIDYIIKDVRYRGIVYNELDDELIDHICTLVEDKMALDIRFIDAYDQVINSFGATKGIQQIQTQTISINNNNPKLMIKNYLKIAIRNLKRHKFYSFINVIGLSIGITCCMMITLFIIDELNYDRYHEYSDRIYRVTMESSYGGNDFNMAVTPAPMAAAILADYPEVEAVARFRSSGTWLIKKKEGDQNIKENRVIYADSTVFDIFSIPFIEGNPKTALAKLNSLVISESLAKKYFGDSSPINKTLILDNSEAYTVTGVYQDMPDNGHFHYDVILTMLNRKSSNDQQWTSNNFHTYILLKEGTDAAYFSTKLPEMVEKYVGPEVMQFMNKSLEELAASGTFMKYHLQALTDIHLHSQLQAELEPNSDIKYIYIFLVIALFLLAIACINFMNLSTARSANRAKEVGVRKVLGSFRSHLIKQFLTESILLTMISFIIAIVLAYLTLPLFNILSNKTMALPFDSMVFWSTCISATLIIGLLAGMYPAFFLSAFKPVSVLKGKLAVGSKSGVIRSLLVVFQFSISIILVVGTFTIFKQLNYIQSKKLGFDKEQVIMVEDAYALGDQMQAFKERTSQLASITSATISGYIPVTGGWRSDTGFWPEGTPDPDKSVSMQKWGVDHDYINTMGMEIVDGRAFSQDFPSDSSGMIINERAAKLFGFENPIGQRINSFARGTTEQYEVYTIVGVVKDFHFQSMKENIDALCLIIGRSPGYAMFKTNSSDIRATVGQIEKEWKVIAPDQPFNYSFLDQEFDEMYQAEQNVGSIFTTFAMLTIFIASLGLFALAAFTAEQRTKEIGVRKVLGATVKSIVFLLSKEFIKLISIAFIVAAPLSWWGISTWLESYTYKTTIGIEVYLVAGLVAFLVAWLTMSYQSIKAAMSNPVNALRSE